MRKALLLVMCIIMFVTLCSCDPEITEGEVYEKEYRAAHTTTMVYPMVISNGKTSTTVMIPYTVFYPDRYVIHIKAFVDGEWVTEDFYVSKEVYDSVNVGDMFLYDEDRGDLTEEPYTKERSKDEAN